ncbi:MAG: YceI family protein [Bacteroidetes bacterium]|nr:YceI family protein [Bacteroidota bacterium]
MKKIFLLLTLVLINTSVFAQSVWKADLNHSKLNFSTVHLGISEVEGLFKKFDVTIEANNDNFSDGVFTLTVDMTSVDTEIEMRDNHLRSADFFDTENYPVMTFKSNSIRETEKNRYVLNGDLTIRGITKPVTMELWYRGTIVNDKDKSQTSGFQLTGSINRSDFNIGTKFPDAMISETVMIKADGEFKKQ